MVLDTDNVKESKASSCKKINKNECSDCEKFQRKIKENERTVSARDVLIEMSQKEIQKLQNLYKNSIDEYETLRFTYCSTVQDFTNLKDIHKKLEEEHRALLLERKTSIAKLKEIEAVKTELNHWKNQYEKLQKNKPACDCSNKEIRSEKNAQSDVADIQNILQNQNQSVKLLLSKFLDELKESKLDQKSNKSCQVGCKTDHVASDENSRKEIEDLKGQVEKLTIENEKIKENLNDKQTHLFKCLNVLEKNHSDIGNLSGHIENICTERDKCIKAIDQRDQEICRLRSQLNLLKESTADVEDLRLEKERYCQENKKLKSLIKTFRADTEEKDKIIDEVGNEKENLHKELGHVRRMSEQLQEELDKANDPKLVEKLNEAIETLRTENERCVNELNRFIEEANAKEQIIEEMTIKLEGYQEEIGMYQKSIEEEEGKKTIQKNNNDTVSYGNNELETLKGKYTVLQKDMDATVEKHNRAKSCLQEKIKQLQGNVDDLGETLAIITEENRSNLNTIENLRKSLNEAQIDHEKVECKGKCAINELQNEVEELRSQLKPLRSPRRDEEVEKITDYGAPNEEVVKLQENIKSLEEDLRNATLEIAEYEEENKAYRQKLEAMTNDVAYLQEEKSRVEDELSEQLNKVKRECAKLCSGNEADIKSSKTKDPEATQAEMSELRDKIETINREKAHLESEKTDLISKIVKLESELENTYHATEKRVSSLVEKLESVEGHNEEIKEKLRCCCEGMSKIKDTLEKNKTDKDSDVKDLETKCMIQDAEILKLRNINLDQAQRIDDLKNSNADYQKRLEMCRCNISETGDWQDEQEKIRRDSSQVEELRKHNESLEEELCRKKCIIISLEECIDKSNRILGDCEDEIKKINTENQILKKDLENMKGNLDKLNCEIDVHKADKDLLEDKVHRSRAQSIQLEAENDKLLRKTGEDQKNIEEKISVLQQKYNKLLEESEAKDIELDEIKKQFEVLQSTCKSPNITNEELQKVKRVSKEIKDLLIEQSKKLNESTEKTAKEPDEERTKCFFNKYVAELESKIKNKETDMKYLESKNNTMSAEILDLKQHVHTLMLDNTEMKRDIINLLNTIISKVKLITISGENLNTGVSSRDLAVAGVLNSLLTLERGISEDAKPHECPINSCNCMSVIKSKYSSDEKEPILSESPEREAETPKNVDISKATTSIGGCIQALCTAYGIRNKDNAAELEEEVEEEETCTKSTDRGSSCLAPCSVTVEEEKTCSNSTDRCSSCSAPCSDINKTVPCPPKETED